jgi:hypothetical protein
VITGCFQIVMTSCDHKGMRGRVCRLARRRVRRGSSAKGKGQEHGAAARSLQTCPRGALFQAGAQRAMMLRLDSAPAVNLRRSTRLPLEVLESIHAFLPRDKAARSPLSTAFWSAHSASFVYGCVLERRIKCRMCRQIRQDIVVFDASADRFKLTRFCYDCRFRLKWHWHPKKPWHRHNLRMRSRAHSQEYLCQRRINDLETLRGFMCIVYCNRWYANEAF